ncbi:UNVERIFIED_CONTAM: hypothetical protein K2H54_073483 [Gekko kuhli]
MSGTREDDSSTVPVTMAEVPTTTASQPITTGMSSGSTTGTTMPRPRPDSTFGVPTFYTPSGLIHQGARLLQPRVVPNPFLMHNLGPVMTAGSLTQWGHFNPGSTMETYILTEGPRRDSRWDPKTQGGYQASSYSTDPGGSLEGSSSEWYEQAPDGCEGTPAEIEVPMEGATGGVEDEDDLWMRRLATLEANQVKIQRHLEEVMMTISEMVNIE